MGIKELQQGLFSSFAPRLVACVLLVFTSAACGNGFMVGSFDESGDETATEITDPPVTKLPDGPIDEPSRDPRGQPTRKLILNQAMNARMNRSKILEFAAELPPATVVEVPLDYQSVHLDYRKSDGTLERSSTGFITPIYIVSVPAPHNKDFPASRIRALNETPGGLHLSGSIVGSLEGVTGSFAVVKGGSVGSGFLKHYTDSGKPKFSYTTKVTQRFAGKLNKGVHPERMSRSDRDKYQRVYAELVRAADRTKETPKAFLLIDRDKATKLSVDFERSGTVPQNGAWTIAVQATAERHGFPNVPCAEFMSEMIREAYQRAGYRVTDDFSPSRSNQLIWSRTAAVVNLSKALFDAGWIPWDSTKYKPLKGAVMMHGSGLSPGHTFMAAGDDGRIIIDNGAPQGRDLRKTSDSTIKTMFQNGVFFLPPGINPQPW